MINFNSAKGLFEKARSAGCLRKDHPSSSSRISRVENPRSCVRAEQRYPRRFALPTSGHVPCTILLSYVWVRHFFHPSFFDFCRCLQTFTLVIFSNTARIRRRMIYVCGADFTAKLASIRKLLAIFGIHRVIKASRKANPMSRRKHTHTHTHII